MTQPGPFESTRYPRSPVAMTAPGYAFDSGLPPMVPPRKSVSTRGAIIIVGVIVAVASGAAALALTLGGSSSPHEKGDGLSFPPQKISRAELMAEYARIAPLDRSATPDTVDSLANSTCSGLQDGLSTDALITAATDIYHANATEVIRLLVSYRCPQFLVAFK